MQLFKNIPKKMYFYWGFNSKMSYLHYLSLLSFRKLNPDWELFLYKPKISSNFILTPYIKNNNALDYIGKDYCDKLDRIENLQIVEFDFDTIGIDSSISEVYKSDYIRWYLLWKYGGGWADMDILFIKPLSTINVERKMLTGESNKVDTMIIFKDLGYHPIAFYLASRDNDFFKLIFEKSISSLNMYEYQSIGSYLLGKIYPSVKEIQKLFPGSNIADISVNTVYSFLPRDVKKIFYKNKMKYIYEETIGVHWYNGHKIAKQFLNEFDKNRSAIKPCTILELIEYIEKL